MYSNVNRNTTTVYIPCIYMILVCENQQNRNCLCRHMSDSQTIVSVNHSLTLPTVIAIAVFIHTQCYALVTLFELGKFLSLHMHMMLP